MEGSDSTGEDARARAPDGAGAGAGAGGGGGPPLRRAPIRRRLPDDRHRTAGGRVAPDRALGRGRRILTTVRVTWTGCSWSVSVAGVKKAPPLLLGARGGGERKGGVGIEDGRTSLQLLTPWSRFSVDLRPLFPDVAAHYGVG